MSRAIWKGHVAFGLLQVPVALYALERRADLQFRMLDSRNQARVRYQRVNEETGEEVPWDEVVKAYEYDHGSYVVVDEEAMEEVAPEATQTVALEAFVPLDAIGYEYFDKPYVLAPGRKGEKAYVLLRETLRNAGKVGIARVVIRTREYLAALLPQGNALLLVLMRFHQELRRLEEFDLPAADPGEYRISDKEMRMAEQLIDSMAEAWRPEAYRNEYQEKLMEWVEEQARKGRRKAAPKDEERAGEGGAEVIDMMSLLKQSLDQEEQSGARKKTTRRKSATRKKRSAKGSSAGGGGRKTGS